MKKSTEKTIKVIAAVLICAFVFTFVGLYVADNEFHTTEKPVTTLQEVAVK